MERTIVVLLALSVCFARCASVKDKGPQPHEPNHSRGKRCNVCDDAGPPHGPHHPFGPPPPPPPPPPFFRTLQYSGLARSNDGGQGVFSGAATAADLNNQAAGQAFSVASSSAGAGGFGGHKGQSSYGQQGQSQSSGYGGQSVQQTTGQLNGYGGQSAQQSSFNGQLSGQSNGYGGQSSNLQSQSVRGDLGLASANSASHGGFNAGEGSGNHASSAAQAYGAGQQQEQNVNRVGFSHVYNHSPKSGKQELQQSENQQQIQSSCNGQWQQGYDSNHGFGNENLQQAQSSGSGQWQQGNSATGSQSSSFGAGKANYGAGAELGQQESSGSALSGALGLASQGLQGAQQTQPDCSTCGSGGYALSNAKSKTGNAVAVSIGG